MIQLIDKDKNKYTLIINDIECVFIPMCLFVAHKFIPIKPFVPKGKSVVKWKVNSKQISYNQIRYCICNHK